MSRYPRAVRAAALKCISCNAPVVENVEGEYGCVECGEHPIQTRASTGPATADD